MGHDAGQLSLMFQQQKRGKKDMRLQVAKSMHVDCNAKRNLSDQTLAEVGFTLMNIAILYLYIKSEVCC